MAPPPFYVPLCLRAPFLWRIVVVWLGLSLPGCDFDDRVEILPSGGGLERTEVTTSDDGLVHASHELVVDLGPDVSPERLARVLSTVDGQLLTEGSPLSQLGVYRIGVPRGASLDESLERLRTLEGVEAADKHYWVPLQQAQELSPNDPSFDDLWGLSRVGAPRAWAQTTGSERVVVAVLDTGVLSDHPDLAENIYVNPGEIPGNQIDDDGNGFVDDVSGWDFVGRDPFPTDDVGHGTHVAGTIGAVGDNGLGVAGVAWQVAIVPIKVCEPRGCPVLALAEGILYAARLGAQVANASLGGYHPPLHYELSALRAYRDSGGIFVAAAGNWSRNNDTDPVYPASYDLDNIVSVAAGTPQDGVASFSNYGADSVDLAAPGTQILSTVPPSRYARFQGTSMAAPHVAGAVSLFRAVDPSLSAADTRERLLDLCEPLPAWAGRVRCGGLLNLAALVGSATPGDGDNGEEDDPPSPPTCADSPCHTKARCQDSSDGVSCRCLPGYEGDGITRCQDIDECLSSLNECETGSECVNSEGGYRCECGPGFQTNGSACQDVDECALGEDTCGDNEICVNELGGYRCECREGFEGGDCADVDECAQGTAACSDEAECQNTVGGFVCACGEGLVDSPEGCVDVDECAAGLHACDEAATCHNRLGSYTCTCLPGYLGDGFFCDDVDECSLPGSCAEGAFCENLDGDYRCSCATGYVGDAKVSCVDDDECASGSHDCDELALCTNTEGGYSCMCPAGYAGDGRSCSDIDECAGGEAQCAHNATCQNTPGAYRCECKPGYRAEGELCLDIDECAEDSSACGELGTCVNAPGRYDCMCPPGYAREGNGCVEIDECEAGVVQCGQHAECVKEKGVYGCRCEPGYEHQQGVCVDQDECARGDDDCDPIGECQNTDGGFDCSCPEGYSLEGHTCVPEPEPEPEPEPQPQPQPQPEPDACPPEENPCDPHARCSQNAGSVRCDCPPGFVGGGLLCEDQDECALGLDDCAEEAECRNMDGSYSCHCPEGYAGDGTSCEDIDECVASGCGAHADCDNRPGTFVCTCSDGYEGDPLVGCTDRDECAEGVCSDLAGCTNLEGSFSCGDCPPGFEGDGSVCTDVDECALGTDDCSPEAECTNTSPGFTCACLPGHRGDGRTCADVDECAEGSHGCDANASCLNTVGGYECLCQEPWQGDGFVCVSPGDVDECAQGLHNCDENATCTNLEGSFRCDCNEGYSGDGTVCSDDDECLVAELNDCDDNATCTNQLGGYSCTCNTGYEGDGRTCEDADQCASGQHDCGQNALCEDQDPGYLCTCATGFTGDGRHCLDVDECAAAELNDCDEHATCTNTAGGFLCSCSPPYEGDGSSCGVNECATGMHDCAARAFCTDTPDGYTCTCAAGFAGDGLSCLDVDECSDGSHACHPDAVCENTVGGYNCECLAGYEGDGRFCSQGSESVSQVDASGDHSCVLLDDGAVRCFGRNTYGQLGYGHTDSVGDDEAADAVGLVPLGQAAVAVSAGVGHSCAVLHDGSVRCFGRNTFGQLGLGHTSHIGDDELPLSAPPVELGAAALQISAGGEHTCALLVGGDVRCWGLNIDGQLGIGSTENVGDDESPALGAVVPLGEPASQVVAGRDHTCARLSSGAVRCWGRGAYAALGYGNRDNLGDDESVSSVPPVELGGQAVDLAAGWYHSCAVLSSGSVRCWGLGNVGQLGYASTADVGDDETPAEAGDISIGSGVPQEVEAGLYHTCVRFADASVRCFGYGQSGRLGYADTESIGDNEHPASAGPVELGGEATDLALGYAHSCAVLSSGGLRCFGDATFGQLGTGSTEPVGDDETPAAAQVTMLSAINECALSTDDCHANATCIDLPGGFDCSCPEPGLIGDGRDTCEDVDECSAGAPCGDHATCDNLLGSYLCECVEGYSVDEALACVDTDECALGTHSCGPNALCENTPGGHTCTCLPGYVGDGAQCVLESTLVAELNLGHEHTCARLNNGDVTCWGRGGTGALGYGNTTNYGAAQTPASVGPLTLPMPATQVVSGDRHTCALFEGGAVRCWGTSTQGALGNRSLSAIGDDEPASASPPVGLAHPAVVLAAGAGHTCALLDSGEVSCWGANEFGQLGYGHFAPVGDDEEPADVAPLSLSGGTVVALAAGAQHTCALLHTGALRCWGSNAQGQLGNGEGRGSRALASAVADVPLGGAAVDVVAGAEHTCALMSDATVRCFGSGAVGALGHISDPDDPADPETGENIGDDEAPSTAPPVAVGGPVALLAAGSFHTCVVLDSGDGTGDLRCFGYGAYGALGYGNSLTVGDDEVPSSQPPVSLAAPVRELAAGGQHTCVLMTNNEVTCFGENAFGQLGYANTSDVGKANVPSVAGFVSVVSGP